MAFTDQLYAVMPLVGQVSGAPTCPPASPIHIFVLPGEPDALVTSNTIPSFFTSFCASCIEVTYVPSPGEAVVDHNNEVAGEGNWQEILILRRSVQSVRRRVHYRVLLFFAVSKNYYHI